MTQVGETQEYSVADHLQAIFDICGQPCFDAVLVQKKPPSASVVQRYAQINSQPVLLDRDAVKRLNCQVLLANVMEEDAKLGRVGHNPRKLASVLLRWYSRL